MDITLSEGTVSGSVTAPASKSYAQRAIAAALLCEGESVLSNMVQCNDTRAALQVAADLGAKISAHEDTYTLHGGLHPRKRQLNIGESGLATRLFTPITALCTETITLTGKGSILKRPISMMEEPLRQLGATVSSQGGYLPIHIRGAIRGGNITVDGSLSSQFITGLLMALPLLDEASSLTVTGQMESAAYIAMTESVLNRGGIALRRSGSVNSQMVFEEGRQHTSLYETPYGELSVDIQTSRLLHNLTERGGLMEIKYSIAVEHVVTGRNCFKIRVRRK